MGRQRVESEKWLGTAGRQRAESGKWLGTAGRQRAESEVESSSRVLFWKMVYRNFFRKPFSFFSFAFLL